MLLYKAALLCSVAVASIAVGAPALAQDATQAPAQAPTGDIPASPAAQAAPASAGQAQPTDTGQIEELVVTATRRSESLQKVPIAVAAFSRTELQATGTNNSQDLAAVTPGLTIANQSAGITPFIRGVGAVDNTVGQEAAVATYVDGVYYTSVYGALFTFNNIERIEVLKGPQGTLFGRNATGGLIQIVTRDPTQDKHFEGAVNYGSYNTIGGRLYASTGLGENLAGDLSMIYRHQYDGWGHNVNLDRDIGFGGNDFAARTKLIWTPSDTTKAKLSLDYSNSAGSDIGSTKNVLPGSVGADGLSNTPGFYNDRAGYDEYVNTKQGGAALTLSHDFDAFSLLSISSYRKTQVVQAFDNDATPIRRIDVLIDNQTYRTFTQELQLLSAPSSPIKYILGAFYMHDKSGFDGPNGLGLYGVDVGGTGVLIHSDITTKSVAAFGEVTVPLGSSTSVTGGFRYTSDERSISGHTDVVGSSDPGSTNVIFALPVVTASFRESRPTWRAIINHNFTPDVMVYASYNRGFKSGNFNTTAPGDAPFHSEVLDAFEVGLKSEFFDRRFRLNAAAFYYKYNNLQLNKLSGSSLLTTNAASAQIKGIDLDGEFIVTPALRLRFGSALLNTEFTDYTGAQHSVRNPDGTTTIGSGGPLGDLTGNDLTRSPHATFNIGAFYKTPLGSGNFDANANFVYNSGFFWEPDNRLKQKAYSLLNAQVGWTTGDDRWSFRLYGKNLAGTHYSVWQVATTNGDLYAPAQPRTVMAEVAFKY